MDIFSKGLTHGFAPKMALFPTFFFQAIQARKMSFRILYIEKTPLQPIKTKSSKTPKSNIFPKALTHSYGPKLAILPNFFLGKIGQENVFYDILEGKNAFLGYKNKKCKKWKNWHFSKGVNPQFWFKIDHFSNFFFIANIGKENFF